MKITRIERILSAGSYAQSPEWKSVRDKIHKAICSVDWPHGDGKFTIFPESGKKSGKGNGVRPIKIGLRKELAEEGWEFETRSTLPDAVRPGPLDSLVRTPRGTVAVEWETGNISSSHRALNKLILGLMQGFYIAGVLVVPSTELAKYLTDRVGNLRELLPYVPVFKAASSGIENGVLEIIEVEHDATSYDVPKIPKGTDGRALR